MNLVADENIDIEIVRGLRDAGYDILSIAEDFFGISDEDVLEIANKHNAILLTGDKDFGELVFRKGKVTKGVILIRVLGVPQEEKTRIVLEVFKQHAKGLRSRLPLFFKSFEVMREKNNKIGI